MAFVRTPMSTLIGTGLRTVLRVSGSLAVVVYCAKGDTLDGDPAATGEATYEYIFMYCMSMLAQSCRVDRRNLQFSDPYRSQDAS